MSVLKNADGNKAFGTIMLRKDFDFDYFFDDLSRDTLIKFIDHSYLKTSEFLSKFEICSLIKYSDKLNYWRFWDIIIDKLNEIKDEEIAGFLNKLYGSIGAFNVDQEKIESCITRIKDPKVALSILRDVKSKEHQKMFFNNNFSLAGYLDNLASDKKIVEIALLVDLEEVWNFLLKKKSVRQYLLNMPINEAIEIARNTKVEAIESIILNRVDFSLECLDTYAYQTESKQAYKLLFQSEFWKPRDSLLKASEDKQRRNGMPTIVLKRESVIDYLATLKNAPSLFSLISGCKSPDVTKFILLHHASVFEYEYLLDMICIHENDQEVFDTLVNMPKLKSFLKSLSGKELIALGKDYESYLLWKYIVSKLSIRMAIKVVLESKNSMLIKQVFDREDLKARPEELVSFAKQIEMYDVWKKILDIPEVKEFYGL